MLIPRRLDSPAMLPTAASKPAAQKLNCNLIRLCPAASKRQPRQGWARQRWEGGQAAVRPWGDEVKR